MLSMIIYSAAVVLATSAVILLALFSPIPPHTKTPHPSFSFFIQHPQPAAGGAPAPDSGAYVFHQTLTEGPGRTSRVVGNAQGFIIPVERFAHSDFNIIYLTFHTHEFSGSVSVQAKNIKHKEKEELVVVGGTGSFAFARGLAVFVQTFGKVKDLDASYHIMLHLKFPNRSEIIPG